MRGRSLTAVMLTVLETGELEAAPVPSLLASVICQLMVRELAVLLTVGSLLVEWKVTERSAAWYSASVALPERVRTPKDEL